MLKSLPLLAFVVLLTACGGSGSMSPPKENQTSVSVQTAAGPLAWKIFANPDKAIGTEGTIYSWPVVDPVGNIAFGVTFGAPGGDPPTGWVDSMNEHGLLVTQHVDSPPTIGPAGDAIEPIRCVNGTQICVRGGHWIIGPNGFLYDGNNNPGVIDLTAGVGNNVWFTTCCHGSYIVHAVNKGTHFYRIPDTSDNLHSIAYAPDGHVWVTLLDHVTTKWHLARLNPTTSVVTIFPFLMPESPFQVVIGTDGNLWFTLRSTTLYRVNSTSALLTRFTLPAKSSGYLAFAKDGHLYVGYDNGVNQGLIELSRALTVVGTFTCPTTVCPNDGSGDRIRAFTVGNDSNVWFAYSRTDVQNDNPPPQPFNGIGVFVPAR